MNTEPGHPEPPSLKPITGKQVLFVDDDPLMLELATPLLAALGCTEVLLAPTRAEASSIIQSDVHFDIAIIDVTLDQDQSGFELAEMALALRPNTLVVQISGLHELSLMREVSQGVVPLQKPFGLTELRALFNSELPMPGTDAND